MVCLHLFTCIFTCVLCVSYECVARLVDWVTGKVTDVICFGTFRDAVFKPLVNFSHYFSCISFSVFFLVLFRCANKPNQICSLHTRIPASFVSVEQLLQSSDTVWLALCLNDHFFMCTEKEGTLYFDLNCCLMATLYEYRLFNQILFY